MWYKNKHKPFPDVPAANNEQESPNWALLNGARSLLPPELIAPIKLSTISLINSTYFLLKNIHSNVGGGGGRCGIIASFPNHKKLIYKN